MPGIPVDEAHRRGGVVPHHMGFALGEAVKAIVVLRPDQCVSADEIIAHARERIAGHKLPKSVDFVDALPRTAAGKVLRPRSGTCWRARKASRGRWTLRGWLSDAILAMGVK